MRSAWGPWVGPLFGMVGWVVGLVVVAAATGNANVLVELVPAALLVSLGLGFALVATLTAVERAFPGDTRLRALALWALIALDVGILLLLCKTWVVPVLARDARSVDALRGLGALTDVPWTLVILTLAAGCVLSFLAAGRMLGARP